MMRLFDPKEKDNGMNKKGIAIFLTVLILLLAGWAAAEEEFSFAWDWDHIFLSSLDMTGREVSQTTLGVPRGTSWPVYSAPFDDAWRAAGGRAKVSASEPFRVLGTAEQGAWSWVEYKTSGGANRIGWARIRGIEPEFSDTFPADAYLARVTRDVWLTDDPFGRQDPAVRLKEGDTVTVLGKAGGDWAYAECEVNGQTAWLFMPQSAAEPVPAWDLSGDGRILTVREGVTRIGYPYLDSGEDEGIYSGLISIPPDRQEWTAPVLSKGETVPYGVEELILPESLRYLGGEAIVYGGYRTIRFPGLQEGEIGAEAMYGVNTDRMVLGKDCGINPLRYASYSPVTAFGVEEGNKTFREKDGVLFSADGRTLIAYPENREGDHYDVPAGTEEIADGAFSSSFMGISLKTVSLPNGLRKIGRRAFCGCGQLISLTVPLTVTDLAEDAFENCVSLERLSLPPGLKASFDTGWAVQADFTHYNGDNWTTRDTDTEDEDSSRSGSWSQINQSLEKKADWQRLVNDTSIFRLGERLTENGEEPNTLDWGTYPSMDGSTVCVPLAMELARQWLDLPEEDLNGFVNFSTTPYAYDRLTKGEGNPLVTIASRDVTMDPDHPVDLVLGTGPNADERSAAEAARANLITVPICYDAFVFLVNSENPVTSLTADQIRDIYSGKIEDWGTVGGEEHLLINAYQRPHGSGSQTAMEELVMQGLELSAAEENYISDGMADLIAQIGNYSNSRQALGYSYLYYVDSLYKEGKIRVLAVDGVNPSPEHLRDGSYPFTVYYYAVYRAENENAARFAEWLLSDSGQRAVAQAGYIPLREK